jgi:glycerol kinase
MFCSLNSMSAIALDLGSTSIKAGLLQQDGTLSGIIALPAPEMNVHEGRYESDALRYVMLVEQVLDKCLRQQNLLEHAEYPPLGLSCQRSSFVIWSNASGLPISPLISWQDNRGDASCVALKAEETRITQLTGLRLTPYFFAAKLRVILLENPNWRAPLERGEWLVGTLDTFLIWRWTKGVHHVTDVSMAARTLLMDIGLRQWSAELCTLFNIPMQILPRILSSCDLGIRLTNGLTLQASVADQSAALLASVGEDRDVALVNLGTGGFVMRYVRDEQAGLEGYLRTLVYKGKTQQVQIANEGTLNSIAAALAPYPVATCLSENLGAEPNIFCIAEPSGLGAPYFRADLGLQFSAATMHLTSSQIACLLLEAIIFRVVRILEEFQQGRPLKRVYLSGGLSELTSLQLGIAQCLSCEVWRLQQRDASLIGAAMLAAGRIDNTGVEAVKILASSQSNELIAKYQRWKVWLDTRLIS